MSVTQMKGNKTSLPKRTMQTRAMKRKEEEELMRREEFELARCDPTKFVYLSKLPNEVRDLIWKHARSEGRIIPLKPSSKRHRTLRHSSPRNKKTLYSPAKVPALLHACRESRRVALKWYKLSFGTALFGQPQTYFDHERDEVFISCTMGNPGRCEGTAITWLMRWEEFGPRRLFVHGPVSRSFITWQYGSFTGITHLVLIPEQPLPASMELTKEMLRPLKGELEGVMRERQKGVEEWCQINAKYSALGISRPGFTLGMEVMEVVPVE